MDSFVKFPKIGKMKDAAKAKARAGISGPIEYSAVVKVHGTNAAVGRTPEGDVFYQSRNRIITPESDNQGFAAWADRIPTQWKMLLHPGEILYGEWAGRGIQNKVAVCKANKFFMPFALWDGGAFDPLRAASGHLFVSPIVCYSGEINFADPEHVDLLEALTLGVEDDCPVGKALGFSGIGAGLVWTPNDPELAANTDLWFKTKGDKSSFEPMADLSAAAPWYLEEV